MGKNVLSLMSVSSLTSVSLSSRQNLLERGSCSGNTEVKHIYGTCVAQFRQGRYYTT